jgi:hypothetical protein
VVSLRWGLYKHLLTHSLTAWHAVRSGEVQLRPTVSAPPPPRQDYYFNTSSTSASPPCTQLFCPIYSLAASPDPVLNASASAPGTNASQPQIYMAVGLDSGEH